MVINCSCFVNSNLSLGVPYVFEDWFLINLYDFFASCLMISLRALGLITSTPNRILECAVAGNAGAIVTGDKAMLMLKKYRHIRIIPLNELTSRQANRLNSLERVFKGE